LVEPRGIEPLTS